MDKKLVIFLLLTGVIANRDETENSPDKIIARQKAKEIIARGKAKRAK